MSPGDLGPHSAYIIASYAIFAGVLAGIILWVRLDGIAQARQLAELDRRGVRRRSAEGPAPEAE